MTLSTTIAAALLVFAATHCAPGQTGPMRQVDVVDPVLQMPAWTVNIPENWNADGTMLPGSSCESATSPVVRASSPDGLTGFYVLPRTDWAWGAIRTQNDCQKLAGVSSARDYLNRFARIRQLDVGDELPVPEQANARSSLESLNQQARGQMHFSTDMA